MGTRIINWKIIGLNAYDKKVVVRDLISLHRCFICTIQETKIAATYSWFVRQLWYDSDLGFEVLPYQGSAGNSGGLLTIWDNSYLEMLDKRMGVNSISCLFRYRNNVFKFIPTNAYSPCDFNLRETFRADVAEIRNWLNEPRCFVGDLNSVRSDAERNKKEMIDLTLHGGAFTWRNKHDDPLLCRLDRFLVCTAFDAKFSNATQTTLVRTISDHNALLLETKLHNLKFFIKSWSRLTFGNVRKEEEDLVEKIKTLNIAEESAALNPSQIEERASLMLKLNSVKVTRARMAYKRAKVKGFKE
ncbi:uncharacterized protein LOC113305834 [Papaver somniferum]|uniref:uncharacterized protein LOC113305834 n=1 Tax=Papaver somniferum TaxID=3469 RepID=UPI000E7048A8|nr:uncharacterized protein LOC113305834 [Papaver somniferum]